MTPEKYLELLAKGKHDELRDWVDLLTNEQRKALRSKLEALGCTQLLMSLAFNYDTQEWI